LVNAIPVREDGSSVDDDRGAASNEEAMANTSGDTTDNRLTFYAPGTGQLRFASGLVKVIKPESYFSWNLHYNATGRPEQDQHTAGLWFTTNAQREVRSITANDVNLYEGQEIVGRNVQRPNIPAYAENYRVSSLQAITSDTTLNSFWPHMHLRGKD